VDTLLFEEDGYGKLGFVTLSCLYSSIAVTSMFSTYIMRKLGEIKSMSLGSILNTPWILTFILISYNSVDSFQLSTDPDKK
jgi:hypothetical protein